MRMRLWPVLPRLPDFDNVESRFPAGSRTGEGSASLHLFLEAARNARIQGMTMPVAANPEPPAHRRPARRKRDPEGGFHD